MFSSGENQTSPKQARIYYLAPLAGYTDLPFRLACRRQGCRFAYTALIDAGALVYRNPHNRTILAKDPTESWLGTQILGARTDLLVKAGRMIREYGFSEVDLNMGCPVPKVTQRGAGAALGLDRERAVSCAEALMEGYGAPVTAKIRILSEDTAEPTVSLALALQHAGVKSIAIHGRTWERRYLGPVAAAQIREVVGTLSIPVVANGGIFSREDAERLAVETGTNRLMIARGAIGNPWIFRDLLGVGPGEPTHEELCEELERHVEGMVELYGEKTGMRQARKIILAYLVGRGYRRTLRAQVTRLTTAKEFRELLHMVRSEGPSENFCAEERKSSDREQEFEV